MRTFATIKSFVLDFLTSGIGDRYSEEERNIFITLNILCLSAVLILPAFGMHRLSVEEYFLGCVDIFMGAFFAALIIMLRLTQKHAFSGFVMVIGAGLLFLFLYLHGPMDSTGILWSYTFVSFAHLILGKKKGLFLSLLFIAVAIALAFFSNFVPIFKAAYSRMFLTVYFITMLILTLVSFIIESFRESARRRLMVSNAALKKNEARLNQLLDDLQRTNADLEIEMNERKQMAEALQESEKRYMELSITDGLTGLYNQRHFYHRLHDEAQRANRYNIPISIMLIDLDDFKQFNDKYGHLEGDKVLKRLADTLLHCIRKTDLAFRYGGEEFIVLMLETKIDQATIMADRIREEFKSQEYFPNNIVEAVTKTVSIGLAQFIPKEDLESFIERADMAMYRAKRNGKDQVVIKLTNDCESICSAK